MKKFLLFLFIISFHCYAQDTIPAAKSVIALDRMNVVYRGVENPISIAVNGAKSYLIYGNGVSKKENGSYVLRPGSGNETKVFIEIENFDGSKVVEEHVFRIKELQAPIGTLNNYYNHKGILEFKVEELINAEIDMKFNSCFLINTEVIQFSIKIPRYPTIVINGNKFTNEVYELLKKARKKDIIIIHEIKCNYSGIEISTYRTDLITFKIID